MENGRQIPPVLEVRGLSVGFDGRSIFRDFDLRVDRGQRVAVTGESGTGKSTLLRCVLGFQRPDGGEIRIDGERLDARTVWTLRRRMGFIAQEPDLGDGKVEAAVRRPFAFKANRHLRYDPVRVGDMFRTFRLEPGLLSKDICRLSGGEKQRVALVSAFLLEREIYLLDEVTSALDDLNKSIVVSVLEGLTGRTLLLVTHDRRLIEVCDRVYSLDLPAGEG